MAALGKQLHDVGDRLEELAAKHRVPGASLAVARGDELVLASTGVTSIRTRVKVDADTLFQIGSITKVYTTSVVMQLIDEGLVSLDEPACTYVPEFELAVPGADTVTVRHLLTHTSGIQGDYFEDFGTGGDAIERYVASMNTLDFVHPVGAMFSYSNSGFVLAGRLIEKVTGLPYAKALAERLLRPAGLNDTKLRPADMLAYRYSVGHVQPTPDADPILSPVVLMPESMAPAGSVTSATASDVVAFARLHLAGGVAPGGRVLSAESAAAMVAPEVALPPNGGVLGHLGLGWGLTTWSDGVAVMSHAGGTMGQLAFLVAIPEHDLAVCLLTNGVGGAQLWPKLGRYIFKHVAGLKMPRPPELPDEPAVVDLAPYAGTYERVSATTVVEPGDDGTLRATTGPLTHRLVPIGDDQFVIDAPTGVAGVAAFVEPGSDGRPQYLHAAARAARRTE